MINNQEVQYQSQKDLSSLKLLTTGVHNQNNQKFGIVSLKSQNSGFKMADFWPKSYANAF